MFNPEDSLIGAIDHECLLENNQQYFNPVKPMDVKLPKFRGLSTEDGYRFLSDFKSLATLHGLDGHFNDDKKIAAFRLHLEGPALQWFQTLPESVLFDFASVQAAFEAKYVALGHGTNPAFLAETELFNHMRLAPGQTIEDFHALILEKGCRLQKSELDVLHKFVDGLPPQLAFFVRAGCPGDHEAALASAKMGEAYGYRGQASNSGQMYPPPCPAAPSVHVAAVAKPVAGRDGTLQDIQQQLSSLAAAVQQLSTRPTPQTSSRAPGSRQPRRCFRCQGRDHLQLVCNWNGQGSSQPSSRCSHCRQYGHDITTCRHTPAASAAVTSAAAAPHSLLPGNYRRPDVTGHGRPGDNQ